MRPIVRRFAALLAFAGFIPALINGCSTTDTILLPNLPGAHTAIVITTDFSTGGLSAIDLDTRQVTTNVASVHSDAALRVHGGLVYVVNRFGQDNIQVINPGAGYETLRQFSTGNGSNPQDIVVVSSTKAYVSRYGSAELLIVNPLNGLERGTISLAGFADSDGLPEMARMEVVGPYLFVACQRLTNFAASNTSIIAVIDTRTDKLVDREPIVPGIQGITLTGRNPITAFAYDPAAHELLIGCAGAFGVADGGIERIDALDPRSLGYAITEAAIGGDVLDIAWKGSTHSYAIVSDAAFNNLVMSWNPTSGAVIDTVYAPGGFSLADCGVSPFGELFVCDNRPTAPGVLIFQTANDSLLAGPLGTGLPPNQVAFR